MSDTKTESFDTEYTDNAICPHCGDEDRDAWEYDLGPGLEGTGIRVVAAELQGRAEAEVGRLRSLGWTQPDFARALKELLETRGG